jgi:hypothetical protein
MDYKTWCENSKFIAFDKSQFEERLLNENSGIITCIYEGNKSYRIIRDKFNDYINSHRGKTEELEEVSFNDFEDDDE